MYIEDQMNNNNQKKPSDCSCLNWAENNTALTELIYALHSESAFDNVDMIAIAKTFESTFTISLGDYITHLCNLNPEK